MPKVILLLDLSEEYGKHLLKGITSYTKENDPWVCCRMPASYRKRHGIQWILSWAKEWGADGVIGLFDSKEEVDVFQNAGIPVIAQDLKERIEGVPVITGAYHLTGQIGAQYFLQKGYRNFAFYGFNDIVWSRERAQGFEEKLNQNGYNVHYYEHDQARSVELWYYGPSELSDWVEALPKPIAVMACDDNQALHITEACKLIGIRIPEDLAVLGVDNDEMVCGISDPPLSSVELDAIKGGYDAAFMMDNMIKGQEVESYNVQVEPTQVIGRRSTDFYSTQDPLVKNVLKFIHENLHENLKIGDVLKNVPLSRRAMEQRFQKVTGQSPYRYICRLRIEKICQELLETDNSIFEVALNAGFEDSKNMARLFKEFKGCTPKNYRKKHLVLNTNTSVPHLN